MSITLLFRARNGVCISTNTGKGYKTRIFPLPAETSISGFGSTGITSPHHSLIVLGKGRQLILPNGEGGLVSDLYLCDVNKATFAKPLHLTQGLNFWSPSGEFLFIDGVSNKRVPLYRVMDKKGNTVWERRNSASEACNVFWRSRDVLVFVQRKPLIGGRKNLVESWEELDCKSRRLLRCTLPSAVKTYIEDNFRLYHPKMFAFLENESRTAIWVQSQHIKYNKQPDKTYIAPIDRLKCLLCMKGKPRFLVAPPDRTLQMVGWLDDQTLIGQQGCWAYDPDSDEDTDYGDVITWNIVTSQRRCLYKARSAGSNAPGQLIGYWLG